MLLSEHIKALVALAPDADRYDSNPDTDVFTLKNYEGIVFLLEEGAGGTGTVKIVMKAADDVVPTNSTAINFRYRTRSGETWSAWTTTTVAADGYTTVAGANKAVEIDVKAAELPEGYPCVWLDLTEVANSPCDAGISALLYGPKYGGLNMGLALA